MDPFELETGLLHLGAELLALVQELLVLLHQVKTLLPQFLDLHILAVQRPFEAVLLLLGLGQLCVVVFQLGFQQLNLLLQLAH